MIEQEPIGYVEAVRPHAGNDFSGAEQSCIALVNGFGSDALQGLDEFAHIEVLDFFHEVSAAKVNTGARHPRNNPDWPAVGIFVRWHEAACQLDELLDSMLASRLSRPSAATHPRWCGASLHGNGPPIRSGAMVRRPRAVVRAR
jgi:hypothetical protein